MVKNKLRKILALSINVLPYLKIIHTMTIMKFINYC